MFTGVLGVRKVTKMVSAGCRPTLFFAPFLLIYTHIGAHKSIFWWYTPPSTWSVMILSKRITKKCQIDHLWWFFQKIVWKFSKAHISELFWTKSYITEIPTPPTVFKRQTWDFYTITTHNVGTKLHMLFLINWLCDFIQIFKSQIWVI